MWLMHNFFFFKEHFLSKCGATKYAQIISSEIILGHWKGNLETLSLNSALRSTYTTHKDRTVELFSGNTAKFPSKSEREVKISQRQKTVLQRFLLECVSTSEYQTCLSVIHNHICDCRRKHYNSYQMKFKKKPPNCDMKLDKISEKR